MTMLSVFVPFPIELVALTAKLKVPAVVGVPEITPVTASKLKPVGSLPLDIAQVIGVVPAAASIWL